jgi:hypothetical protein
MGAVAAGPSHLSAQGHLVSLGGEINHGSLSVSPRWGVNGSTFKIAPKALPPNTDVQIMMGALHDGFEVVKVMRTDESGRLASHDTLEITVPDWVRPDRPYLVMLTDMEYNPLAQADMFHPTRPDGTLVRRGTVKVDPSGCRLLMGEDGEEYILTGDLSGLMPEKEMLVAGRVTQPTACGTFTTISVQKVKLPPY